MHPYPFATHALSVQGISIAYVDEGQGKIPIVFIHGLGSYLPAWKKTINHLKGDHRCIALDLPNFGLSEIGDFPASMTFQAQLIISFLDQLNIQRCVLAGHSMGAQIAMTTYLKNPERISALILMAPSGFETFSATEKQWILSFYNPNLLAGLPYEQIARNFEINFTEFPDDAKFMIEDRIWLQQDRQRYQTYCRAIPACVKGMLQEPVYSHLTQIKVPTFICFGAADNLIPNRLLHPNQTTTSLAIACAKKIPQSTLEIIPDSGHFPHWEHASIVNQHCSEFLFAHPFI